MIHIGILSRGFIFKGCWPNVLSREIQVENVRFWKARAPVKVIERFTQKEGEKNQQDPVLELNLPCLKLQ